MEVAGQWRREWAGTAEYGKVTEGGVTRRVARAMEVLHASGPGARVRVMRAAYHESAGPGTPAASYLMQASRRVISSGFNLLEPPTFPSKPLEISSTPLESSPEPNTDTENYKVTEPDDFEISEPSKWRSSTGGSSIRMPSEESSSTDNASIIDLDSRHRNILRKYSYDSENSDIPTSRRNISRLSPLLDSPSLSTLKYKSLLNGSNDWNNRRKSYSFEDTSPLKETIIYNNDTLAMESSTDSGICKSTEIVNEPDDKNFDRKERKHDQPEETFKDWLSKNRLRSSFNKGSHKSYREHNVVVEEPPENSIALQSKGKVSITVPIKVADDYDYKKNQTSDDTDRRTKKVEFCKTELHFAAETGKVNIIATDEKPPSSNDFRKRRSAFVPINGTFDKPVTLFGETTKEFSEFGTSELTNTTNEISEFDENTAATKSILKNKIPKPKPYLLGENMAFGTSDLTTKTEESIYDTPVPTAVSLINRQLQSERAHSDQTISAFMNKNSSVNNDPLRTINAGPLPIDSLKLRKKAFEVEESSIINTNKYYKEASLVNSVQDKLNNKQKSPVEKQAKTRHLRDSDLMYFGVKNDFKVNENVRKYESKLTAANSSVDDLFHSVRLIQKVSSSVCNSEAESEDTPEYQNIPIKTNFAPVPTPRLRSKYDTKPTEGSVIKMLRPVIESDRENVNVSETRRSRHRRQEESTHTSRSISEPPKNKYSSIEKRRRPEQSRSSRNNVVVDSSLQNKKILSVKRQPNINISEEEEPTYVNLGEPKDKIVQRTDSIRRRTEKLSTKPDFIKSTKECNAEKTKTRKHDYSKRDKDKINNEKMHKSSKDFEQDSLEKKPVKKIRTEKLATPEYPDDKYASNKSHEKDSRKASTHKSSDTEVNNTSRSSKHKHRSRSSQRLLSKARPEELVEDSKSLDKKESKNKEIAENGTVKYHTRTSSKVKSGKRESSNHRNAAEIGSTDSYRNSTQARQDKNPADKNPSAKSDEYKSSKRSEYIINYDDKNGTVSSVCKVKPSLGSTSRKKNIVKEKIIESPKDYKIKNKATEKVGLLQLPEHQWDPHEMNYDDGKWKRKKMHAHRSCQLL